MKLSRAAGQTSQILNLFAQDFSVTTGAGIANIPATTVSYSWFHNSQTGAVSTGTGVSTASVGNYTSGAWTQISSSLALGWYQFGIPDGALATGDCVGLHLYVSTGAFNMAPIPVEIELVRDNPLQFTTSKVFLAHTSTSPANVVQAQGQNIVTSASGILNVSTQALTYTVNVSAWANSTVAATSSGIVDVNLVNIWNKSAVTSASGQLLVSTQSLVGIVVSTQSLVGITTAANVIQAYGSAIVTSASGQFLVSTQSLAGIVVSTQSLVGITTAANVIQVYSSPVVTSASGQFLVSTQSLTGIVVSTQSLVGITTAANLIQVYGSAIVTSGSGILNVSTQTLGASSGDLVTIYGQPVVTSGAGILRVSTQSLIGIVVSTQTIDKGGYGVTTNADKTGYTLTAADKAAIMDVINTTVVSEAYQASSAAGTVTQLMYEVLANVTDMVNSGTSRTLNSVTSHTAITVQYQYDSTMPSAITRIA